MPRPVSVRDAEDWHDEMVRLRRLSRAAEIEPQRSEQWRREVRRHVDALLLLIACSPDGESTAIEMAHDVGGGR